MSPPSLPAILGLSLEQPVLVFTVAMAVFLVGPLLVKRLGQPGIVGIVVFGTVLGPNALALVEHSDAIVLLGEVGLIYLLFTVGLELDIRRFREAPENAALFGLTSFFLPFFVGAAVTRAVLGLEVLAALLLAAVFASHTLLAYPIVNRLGVTKNRAVTAVFGGILFTDTIALVVLALVMGAADGDLTPSLVAQVAGSLVVLFGGAWFVLPPTSRWFFRTFSEESYFEFLFVMVAIFATASLAELLDLAPILGAFVAGIALNQLVPEGGTLMNRIEFVGNAFFIPFFLFHVGMLVDPGIVFDGPTTLQIAALIVGVMLVTKAAAAWLVAAIQGYTRHERGVVFGLSTGQAAAALAITIIGAEDLGLFGPEVLNAVVLMLLVTALVSPWLTERAATRLALDREVEDGDDRTQDPTILLPLSHNAELQQRLLELAFVVKGERGSEPVTVMTVVQPDRGGSTESQVAAVRAELEDLAAEGSAAEVPIETETRINHNVASGIVQGAVEVGADQILMGWDATESFRHRVFGSIIDQVLERTTLPVVVSRLGHPINTTRRLFVVVPIGADHHEGFYEAVHLVKRLATGLGAELRVLVVGGSAHQFEHLFGLVEEDVPAEFDAVDWNRLLPTLESRTDDEDLVVTIAPRRGDVGWHSRLETLPGDVVELPPESFVTIHPRQGEPEYDRQYLRFK